MAKLGFVGITAGAAALVCAVLGSFYAEGGARARVAAPAAGAGGPVDVFEPLRGRLTPSHGYFFAVSADEEWLAVVHAAAPGEQHRVVVLHQPTNKVWSAARDEWLLGAIPDCFSADSQMLVLGRFAAPLDPSMSALQFVEDANDDIELAFLGMPEIVAGRRSGAQDRWVSLSQREGEFGELARSAQGVVFEERADGADEHSKLRIRPPGEDRVVDYTPVLDADRKRLLKAAAAQPPELGAILKEHADTPATMRLAQLAVSPDGKTLAAVATLYRGQVGFAGRRYGVLISLGSDRIVAQPFADNVYGKIVWSRDGGGVYFYKQSDDGSDGTVHRLTILDD